MKKIFFICLVLLFCSESCTVTKRVHRKGWHVEWHKTMRGSSESVSQSDVTERTKIKGDEKVNHPIIGEKSVDPKDESNSVSPPEIHDLTQNQTHEYTPNDNLEIDSEEVSSPVEVEQTPAPAAKSSSQRGKLADFFRNLGLASILLGLLAGLAGLGLYFWGAAVISQVLKVILFVFTGLFWAFGALAIIFGIVVLFVVIANG
ncbi:MAG: hypothetical protein ACI837_000170 [Crocinitomicaceae bacterium]|jgi:hypothetical protein